MIARFDDDVAKFIETDFAIEHIDFVIIVGFCLVTIYNFVVDEYFFL